MKLKINGDLVGIGASLACAVHCAILPVFLSGLSIFGVNIIHNFWFESGMILFAFAVGMSSLRHGFIRHHNRYIPFLLFISGMFFLLVKQFWHEYEMILLPFALILIISAHIFNFRFIRKYAGKREEMLQSGCLHHVTGQ
ncbi:MAG TPA: MerC domain-containing protein [Puia sp.]|nr:MerC domain-containing protein [Puia sp.]